MFDRLLGGSWGSLDLAFENRGYQPGDQVTGSITVNAKRAIGPGRLYLVLTCREKQSRTVSGGGGTGRAGRRSGGISVGVGVGTQQSSRQVWREEFDVTNDVSLDAGSTSEHAFSIDLPAEKRGTDGPELPEWARGAVAVIDALTFRHRELAWNLQARYGHAAGFDLRHTRSLTINA